MISKLLAGNLLVTKFKNLPLYFDWSRTKTPGKMPAAISETPASEIKKIVNGSVVTWEGIYQGRPIRVRIYNEQTQAPSPDVNK